jgi:cyclic-di-AMP phosphodiesterase PgpH
MQHLIQKIRSMLSYKVFTLLIFFLLAVVLYGVLYNHVKPETYDIELFSIAEHTIRSPITIQDEAKTEEERLKAAEEVEDVYVYKEEIGKNRLSLLTSIFDFIQETKLEAKSPHPPAEGEEVDDIKQEEPSIDTQLSLLKSKLTANVSEDVTLSLSEQTFKTLLLANDTEFTRVKTIVEKQVEMIMQDRIRNEEVEEKKKEIEEKISKYPLEESLKRAAIELGSYAIVANEIFDEELTDKRKKVAMENVEPVKILEGQVIVLEGHLIDREKYRQLQLLGLLNNNMSKKPFFGLAIFVLIIIGALYYHFKSLPLQEEKKQTYLILLSIIFITSIILMKIVGLMEVFEITNIGYIYPAAMAPMLVRIMLNERLAIMMTIILAACGSIVFHDALNGIIHVEIAVYILFSGLAGILFLSKTNHRSNILQAGFFVSFVNVLLIFSLILLANGQLTNEDYMNYIVFAFTSGVMSAILTIGLLPFFEAGFGILSTIRLIELSNPNHPLLKKILTEAPGTYHHSVMVANLAESACEAIGANGLLARVGCYYHDIGKTKRPHFFIENQMNSSNPHDRLSPETSKEIIIAHAVDGAKVLRKHKMPKEIVDIAEQHHGTTLLKYFYHKAKELGEDVDEQAYRYPGPKPQSKEAAVVSIADSVEAAVRSLNHPTPEQIKQIVQNIVQDRLQDGQFNECDITLKELEVVKKTLCETLNGIFHSRIEYPDVQKQTEGEEK